MRYSGSYKTPRVYRPGIYHQVFYRPRNSRFYRNRRRRYYKQQKRYFLRTIKQVPRIYRYIYQ